MPLISTIIIFFNEEQFLAEAIESVLAQSYPSWELLLVDDGSTDRSSEIARGYCARDPGRIRYLEHPGHRNRGMSASRNLGIEHSNGEYVAFLDADDVWLPEKVRDQVKAMEDWPEAGMVWGPVQHWYSWSGAAADRERDYVAWLGVAGDTLLEPPAMLLALLRRATVSSNCSLIRRNAIERVGGYEDEFTGMFEDQVFAAKLALAVPVFVTARWHYRWRKHADSACAVAVSTRQYERERLRFLQWLEAYLTTKGIGDRQLHRAVKKEMRNCRHPQLEQLFDQLQRARASTLAALKNGGRRLLPAPVRHRLWAWRHREPYSPPVGYVRFGNLRRLTPVSANWGFERGMPVDRYYIERFLSASASDIRGRVLEIADRKYTRQFGGDRVTRSDVLHPTRDNPEATIVADLTRAEEIPSDTFDCVICTQTLMLIYDVDAAIRTLYRILKPGGVLLLTLAGVSPRKADMQIWGDYWRFTKSSAERLCEAVFPRANIAVSSHGNLLTATAFLHGLAAQELRPEELDVLDPEYEVAITVRAVKPGVAAITQPNHEPFVTPYKSPARPAFER